jgi:prolyl oligopeptidase
MKDDQNPEWLWSVDFDEVEGKYLALYIVKDTSRVRLVSCTGASDSVDLM